MASINLFPVRIKPCGIVIGILPMPDKSARKYRRTGLGAFQAILKQWQADCASMGSLENMRTRVVV